MSDSARYAAGAALRGGIPLCWPWFGAATDASDRPQHGYARTSEFSPTSSHADTDMTAIVLKLDSAAAPWQDWHDTLALEFEIRLADGLWMELRSRNLVENSVVISSALHSYFRISRRDQIELPQLIGLDYLDKLQDYRELTQADALVIDQEVDRVYQKPPATVLLKDSGTQRVICVDSWGNNNLVVWNPGSKKAASMADFDDSGFEHMVCIEAGQRAESKHQITTR